MNMSEEQEIRNYALCFASAIEDAVRNDENENNLEVSDKNATEVMTGAILGTWFAFNRLTGNKYSYMEFTHAANQLVVQYLMKLGDVVPEKTTFNR